MCVFNFQSYFKGFVYLKGRGRKTEGRVGTGGAGRDRGGTGRGREWREQ